MASSSGQPGLGKKIGHRGVDASGETTYKKVLFLYMFLWYSNTNVTLAANFEKENVSCFNRPVMTLLVLAFFLGCDHHLCLFLPQTTSSALKGAIQLGIGYTVGNLSSKPERDVLMQDFYVVESIFFPR